MVRNRTVLALCDPEPFTVATWMLKSLTTGPRTAPGPAPCTANSVVAINTPYQRWINAVGKHSIIRQRASGGKWDSVAVPPAISVRCGRSTRLAKIQSRPAERNKKAHSFNGGYVAKRNRIPRGRHDCVRAIQLSRRALHLKELCHVTELVVARIQQGGDCHFLQLRQILFEGIPQKFGRGVVVVMRAAGRLRDDLVAETHLQIVFG